jgi:outer membrane lipoprotein-sorting protein
MTSLTKIFLGAFGAVLCFWSGVAHSQTPATATSEADFAERLRTVSAATGSIECDFTLTRTMSVMAGDVVSEGRFGYLRGAGISLDFTRPAGDAIVMGRERFRIVSGGKTSTVRLDSNPALRQLQRMLTACMTGDVATLGSGSQMSLVDRGAEFVVTLTPTDRRTQGVLKNMTLTFEKKKMSLTTLRMEESGGDVSVYRFFNKRFNGAIDATRFEIK